MNREEKDDNDVDFNNIELPISLINTSSGEKVSVVSLDGDVVYFVGVNGIGFNKRRDFVYDKNDIASFIERKENE